MQRKNIFGKSNLLTFLKIARFNPSGALTVFGLFSCCAWVLSYAEAWWRPYALFLSDKLYTENGAVNQAWGEINQPKEKRSQNLKDILTFFFS